MLDDFNVYKGPVAALINARDHSVSYACISMEKTQDNLTPFPNSD